MEMVLLDILNIASEIQNLIPDVSSHVDICYNDVINAQGDIYTGKDGSAHLYFKKDASKTAIDEGVIKFKENHQVVRNKLRIIEDLQLKGLLKERGMQKIDPNYISKFESSSK